MYFDKSLSCFLENLVNIPFFMGNRDPYLLVLRKCVDLQCGKSISHSINYLLGADFVSISIVAKCTLFFLFAYLLRSFVSKKSVSATDEKRVE